MSQFEPPFDMATPQFMSERTMPQSPNNKSKSARVVIDDLLKYYEATSNTFFLNKIRVILKHIRDGPTNEIGIYNDLTNRSLQCIRFAIGDQPLTSKEAEDLATLIDLNEGGKKEIGIGELSDPELSIKKLHQAAENIIILKNALLATSRYLDPTQTTLFITRACVRLEYTNAAATAVAETLKDFDDLMATKSKSSKIWLYETQTKLSQELMDKETELRKNEAPFNAMSKAMKKALDMQDLKAKLEAVQRLNKFMAVFIDQHGGKMKGLADDIENLKQLGVTGKYFMLRF